MRELIGNCVVMGALLGSLPACDAEAAPPATTRPTVASEARLQQAMQRLSAGDASSAAAMLSELVKDAPAGLDHQAAFTAAGKAYSVLHDYRRAAEAFEAALTHASQPSEVIVLRLAAADAALRCDRPEDAIEHCQYVLRGEPNPPQKSFALRTSLRAQLKTAAHSEALELLEREAAEQADEVEKGIADFAIRIGTSCLKAKEVATAYRSYQWYLANVKEGPSRQVAELGIAWAAAMGAESPDEAAQRMQAFLTRYPESPDRAAVLQAEAACWRRAGRDDLANRPLVTLVGEVPGTAAALRALDQLSAAPHDEQSPPVVQARRRTIGQSASNTPLTANILAAAIRDAAVEDDEEGWHIAVDKAMVHAAAGDLLSDALARLMQEQEDAYAERLAAQVLNRLGDPAVTAAIEAVTRWAADSGRWSMLALASENHEPTTTIPDLGPKTSRLIAEAFMQGGRAAEAKQWYDGVVEQHALSDFASLLRRAELAVALDSLPIAEKRLAAAKAAATGAADQAVVEILTAEQLIRQAKLDESRGILQRIVRWEDAHPEVRCRAQWLIGETLLMQQRYADAVDAYRRVEVLNDSGRWAPAALVQAGKAFEKMGRAREASICYSGLLRRFADSEHAVIARERLATIRETTTLR